MSSNLKVLIVVITGVLMSIIIPCLTSTKEVVKDEEPKTSDLAIATEPKDEKVSNVDSAEPTPQPIYDGAQPIEEIVYDNMTMSELSAKLNRSLKSTLSGTGEIFAKYAVEMNVDPYIAVAIVLHETGCNHKCSAQVRECYNVGGMKGGPSCQGTSYKRFSSLNEGIYSYMKNLQKNYFSKGLTTPEKMNSKYAASTAWSGKVKGYVNKIKNA